MSAEKQGKILWIFRGHWVLSLEFASAFQEVAVNPLPFATNLLRPFHLIPGWVFLVPVYWVLGKCSVGDAVPGKTVCIILSLEHLRLELGRGGWEGSTCTILPFPGSHPGGITLCLNGGFSRWWITSVPNTLNLKFSAVSFQASISLVDWFICPAEWLVTFIWFFPMLLSELAGRFRVYRAN